MKFSENRIIFIFFVFSIFGASLFVSRSVAVRQFLFNRTLSSPQINVTEEMLLEKFTVSFPDIVMQLSKLNPEQQKKLIEKVRHDMVSFASASGQSDEQAQKLGRIVAASLSKAISHPSIVDAYF